MNTHTPGPWHVSGNEQGTEVRSAPIGVLAYVSVAGARGLTLEEAQANARLIAAAPDLLEACRRAKEFLDSGGLDWLGKDDDPLEAAIAKATGQSPSSPNEETA